MASIQPLQAELLRWSTGHAAAMAVVTLAIAAGLPTWLLSVCGVCSFSVLVHRCRQRWTAGGRLSRQRLALAPLQRAALPWFAPGDRWWDSSSLRWTARTAGSRGARHQENSASSSTRK